MKTLKILSLGLITILFCRCGGGGTINQLGQLRATTWALSSLEGNGLDMQEFSRGIPSLNFMEGGKLTGFTGCNNFSGSFALEGSSIQLDPGIMTKMACPGQGEQDFLRLLEQVGDIKLVRNKLTLLQGNTEVMTFVPRKEINESR